MKEKDYYEILEISRNASNEVIKNAYRALAKKYHPDTSTSNNDFMEKKMHKINEAYEVLSNKEKRAIYDEELKEKEYVLKQEFEKDKINNNIIDFEVNETNLNKGEKERKGKTKNVIIILILAFIIVTILSFIIVSTIMEPSYLQNDKKENQIIVENVNKQEDKNEKESKKNTYDYEEEYDINSYNDDIIIDSDINIVDNVIDETKEDNIKEELEEEDNIVKIY